MIILENGKVMIVEDLPSNHDSTEWQAYMGRVSGGTTEEFVVRPQDFYKY